MEEITAVELAGFSELLTHEENIIKKYKCYAQTCEDPALKEMCEDMAQRHTCLLYTSPSPRDTERSRMPSSA